MKSHKEQEKIQARQERRKLLLKELYENYFENDGLYEMVSVKGELTGKGFEKYSDYQVLATQGFISLVIPKDDQDKRLPRSQYWVELTPKGILYYESL